VRRALGPAVALSLLALPALARAAEEAGEEGGVLFWEWANLLLLLAALVYLGRKPVATFLAERRSRIERDLEGAEQLLHDADARLREWSARAARLDDEVAEIQRVARATAQEEADRIVADARAAAERIRRDAAAAVQREADRARSRLRQEAADLAIAAAERRLRAEIQPDDGDRLFEEFVARIERPGAAGSR
jgi:F-type H+-transporting ATPase subunit b